MSILTEIIQVNIWTFSVIKNYQMPCEKKKVGVLMTQHKRRMTSFAPKTDLILLNVNMYFVIHYPLLWIRALTRLGRWKKYLTRKTEATKSVRKFLGKQPWLIKGSGMDILLWISERTFLIFWCSYSETHNLSNYYDFHQLYIFPSTFRHRSQIHQIKPF